MERHVFGRVSIEEWPAPECRGGDGRRDFAIGPQDNPTHFVSCWYDAIRKQGDGGGVILLTGNDPRALWPGVRHYLRSVITDELLRDSQTVGRDWSAVLAKAEWPEYLIPAIIGEPN